MVATFPLPAADWFGALPVSSLTLDPVEHIIADMTGLGEWISDDVAPMLWQGELVLARMSADEAAHAQVMMDLIRPAGRLFYLYDTRRPAPLADPQGTILGAATPTIAALPGSGREIALTGLPPGYQLSRGDLIGWTYSGGRRALHRLAEAATANGSGITPAIELSTLIRPGVTVGTAVTLIRPAIPVMRVPGSVTTGATRGAITEGFTLRFSQTLGVIA